VIYSLYSSLLTNRGRCSILTSLLFAATLSLKIQASTKQIGGAGGAVVIDVIIADHQELFRIGMAEVLATADDVSIVGQAQSPEQLLNALRGSKPHVLILSTSFLPVFSKIQRMLKQRRTALLVLAEDNDLTDYMRWLRARGTVRRSMDGPAMTDAMRRVARGELFVQERSSDIKERPSEVPQEENKFKESRP
jgi:DNA-binding NarL/FixJ family response regulator